VTFKVKDYRIEGAGRYKTLTLDVAEFIRRFLIHILPHSTSPNSPALHPRARSWEASGRRPVSVARSFGASVRNPSPKQSCAADAI
jgi:hypothetical protein